MSSRPVPKPRPPPKPDVNALGKKPVVAPKPRRTPLCAPTPGVKNDVNSKAPTPGLKNDINSNATTPGVKNDINSNAPPKRPYKPVHLSTKSKTNEKHFLNDNDVKESAKPDVDVNEDTYDDVRVDAEDSNKPDFKGTESEDINSNTKRHIVSRLPPTKPPPKLPSKSGSEITQKLKDVPVFPVKESKVVEEQATQDKDDQLDNKPSRPIKKRMATRRPSPGQLQTTSVSISIPDAIKRRPPPPPPPSEEGSPPKRAGSLKGPEVPKDHLRATKSDGVHKASSTENIPKTAEEQSLYSYAYDHTFIAPSIKAPKVTTINNSPVITQDDSYVEPDTSAVAGFMEELKNKELDCVSDGTYEFPANEGIERQESYSFISEAEYVQPEDIIKDEDEDSEISDSDGEPDYEIPCESPPPIPPHRSPLRSGSYDITSPDDDESDDDDEEDDYVEPPDAQGFSFDEESDGEPDPFIGDESSFEEPLYQVYTARTLKRDRTLSRKPTDSNQNETSFDDLTKGTLRNMRMLWCEVPEVIASGILETIDANERKRQEAMFEVITSEASYLKSLNILESHFINSPELTPGTSQSVIEKAQHHIMFSNVRIVKEASQKFLDRLRQRSSESIVVSAISDIIEEFASKHFEVYVKYCSNQMYQDRVIKELRKFPRFLEGMEKLEKSAAAQCLSLQSFLVLPMQRITRLPLLVDAICHRCEPGSDEFVKTDAALKAIHKVVRDCNEGARKMERMEEMVALQPQIEFTSKPIALVSANRWLLRRGEVILVIEQTRSPLSKKKLKLKPVYMFLFNDLLLITKKKGESRYRVLDYAARNMTKVEESIDRSIQLDYMLSLILLENCNNKTKDFLLCAESETDKTRWLEAFNPPKAEREGEKVYGAWDCPQVQAIHDYIPQQPDELALHDGDVINVQRKLPDGWHYGERLCDGVCGWFPANYTENIVNEHVRARNLLQRYRLLAASKHLIGAVQTMKAPKTSKLTLKAISATLKEPKRDTFS